MFAVGNTISCYKECHIKRPYGTNHISLLSSCTKVQGGIQTLQCVPLGIFCKYNSITPKQLVKVRRIINECLAKLQALHFLRYISTYYKYIPIDYPFRMFIPGLSALMLTY